MTMQIDRDILEVEQRIAQRRMSVELTARAAWRRSVSRVFSPVGMLSAAAVGFITVASILRRRPKIIERRKGAAGRGAGKWGSVLGLLVSGGFALLKAQYGGNPVHMVQSIAGQVKAYKARKSQERARKTQQRVHQAGAVAR